MRKKEPGASYTICAIRAVAISLSSVPEDRFPLEKGSIFGRAVDYCAFQHR